MAAVRRWRGLGDVRMWRICSSTCCFDGGWKAVVRFTALLTEFWWTVLNLHFFPQSLLFSFDKKGLCCMDQMSTAHHFLNHILPFSSIVETKDKKNCFPLFFIFCFLFFRYFKELNNAWFTFGSTLSIGGRLSRSRLSLVWRRSR